MKAHTSDNVDARCGTAYAIDGAQKGTLWYSLRMHCLTRTFVGMQDMKQAMRLIWVTRARNSDCNSDCRVEALGDLLSLL